MNLPLLRLISRLKAGGAHGRFSNEMLDVILYTSLLCADVPESCGWCDGEPTDEEEKKEKKYIHEETSL
jgi:hypothetical protein